MAAITAQELNVILSARDREFSKAMDRANRRVERFSKKSQKDLSKTTKAFGTLSTAVGGLAASLSAGALTAGFVRGANEAMHFAKEIEKLSRVSGVGVERFQELTFAARRVGVEQDKLADILKDTNDKFGDFFQNEAGPLKDFFDNIAPKVGLTADEFKGLSSEQALGKYVKALEDANLSQAEMTFYLEAIASDATLLAPLFINNAQSLDTMTTSARELGAVLSNDSIVAATAMKDHFDMVFDALSTKFRNFMFGVVAGMDAVHNITNREKLHENAESMAKVREKLAKVSERIRKNQMGESRFPSEARKALDLETQTARQLSLQADLNRLQAEDTRLRSLVEGRQELLTALDNMTTGGTLGSSTSSGSSSEGGDDNQSGTSRAAGYAAYAQSRLIAAREAATAAAKAAAEEAEIFEDKLNEIFEPFMTETVDQAFENSIKDLTPLERDIKRLEKRRDAMIEKSRKAYKDAGRELRGYDLVQVENIAFAWFHAQKAATEFEHSQRAAREGLEKTAATMEKVAPKFSELESAIKTMEDGLSSAFMRLLDDSKSFEAGIRNMANEVVRELYRVLVVRQMVSGIMSATGLDLFSGPSTGSFGLPFGNASGGAVYPGKPTVVGEHGREIFVPSSAGRILSVPQSKSAVGGGGDVIVQQTINVTTGVQQTVRNEIKSMMPQIAESAKGAVADARQRGGSYRRALG
jgi:hypothetical protein